MARAVNPWMAQTLKPSIAPCICFSAHIIGLWHVSATQTLGAKKPPTLLFVSSLSQQCYSWHEKVGWWDCCHYFLDECLEVTVNIVKSFLQMVHQLAGILNIIRCGFLCMKVDVLHHCQLVLIQLGFINCIWYDVWYRLFLSVLFAIYQIFLEMNFMASCHSTRSREGHTYCCCVIWSSVDRIWSLIEWTSGEF